jgi:hypothetical protein
LQDLLPDLDVVILWDPSRGDRTLSSWVGFLDRCREHRIRIHATAHQRTYDPNRPRDYRSLAEDGVDAAYAADKISTDVRRGKTASAIIGRPQGPVIYGYRRLYDPVTKLYDREVEHPDQAPIVRRIFTDTIDGKPVSTIARELQIAGIPTPSGAAARWRYMNVARILTQRRYAPHPDQPDQGVAVYLGGEYVGTWPPLVDQPTWERVQQLLGVDDPQTRAARRWSPPGALRHLLSGSIRLLSAPCRSPLSGRPAIVGHQAASYGCMADGCVCVPRAEADEYVTRLVVARLSRKDARALWAPDSSAVKKARAELGRLEKDMAENDRAYRAGEISARLAGLREAELMPLIEAARRRTRPQGAPLGALKLMDAARIAVEQVRPTWDGLELLAKREVIAAVFASLVLQPATEPMTRWTTPEQRAAIVVRRIRHEWTQPAA